MSAKRESLNMTDLAQRAGVSTATVSRALSGSTGVSTATRERIRTLADELGYAVSPDAARLARGTTGRVAVVTPNLSHWFYAAMLDGIVTALHGADVDVLLYEVKQERERRRFFTELPARRQVDAVVLIAMPISDDERHRLDLMDVTVVMAGGTLGDHPHVRIDDVEMARQATQHLLLAGHREIAMIGARGTWSLEYGAPADRLRGFTAALEEAGVPARDELQVRTLWGTEGGAEGMSHLLGLPRPPTAVVAFSDEVAFGALQTLRRAGVAVPHTVSVVGMDDHELAATLDLTTVRQPVVGQGEAAGRMVRAYLAGAEPDQAHMTLPTRLVARGTTGPGPAAVSP